MHVVKEEDLNRRACRRSKIVAAFNTILVKV